MNIIVYITLIVTGLAFGSGKTFTVPKKTDCSAKTLVDALEPLLQKPLSWCSIEPIGELQSVKETRDSTTFKININIKCDETLQRKYLKSVWLKESAYINSENAAGEIDREVASRYNDIDILWGTALNDHPYVKIHRKSSHGGTLDYNNKTLFFNIIVNGNTLPAVYRASLPGNILTVIETNTNKPVMSDTLKYSFTIDNDSIGNEITVLTDHVWHVDDVSEFVDSTPF